MNRYLAGSLLGGAALVAATAASADTVAIADDAHVNLQLSGFNLGAATSLGVRGAGIGGVQRAYVRFDLSALPPQTSVARATLRLWADSVHDAGTIGVHLVTGSWSESTISVEPSDNPGNVWVACRPMVDGVWAGTYGGTNIPANAPFTSYEGFLDLGTALSGQRWRSTRAYLGIPAGNHTLAVQCWFSMELGFLGPARVSFVELKP